MVTKKTKSVGCLLRVAVAAVGQAATSSFRRIYLITRKRIHKSNPITGLGRPLGSQEVEVPRYIDNRHMKVVRLSALRTGRLYPSGKIPGTHFC
jgi:hypothetical protein